MEHCSSVRFFAAPPLLSFSPPWKRGTSTNIRKLTTFQRLVVEAATEKAVNEKKKIKGEFKENNASDHANMACLLADV